MAINPFTRHPRSLGESYAGHGAKALAFGVRMIGGGIACLVHAVFPFLFEHSASRTMDRLHRQMTKRADAPNWERHPII